MTTPTTERPPSVWEDLLEIFYAPTAVFQRRRETPAFGLALVIFVVITTLLSLAFKDIMDPVFDAEFKRGMAQAMKQNPQLTPEMAENFKNTAKKFVVPLVAVTMVVLPLVVGLILWLVGKVLESTAELGQLMMVATYAMFPRVLENIVNAAQLLALPMDDLDSRFRLTFGVGRFLDPVTTNPLVYTLLTRVDLFTIWVTALLAIGLAVMGKLPRGRAVLAGVLMWVVGALYPLWGAFRSM
jgi:hypothetical protein